MPQPLPVTLNRAERNESNSRVSSVVQTTNKRGFLSNRYPHRRRILSLNFVWASSLVAVSRASPIIFYLHHIQTMSRPELTGHASLFYNAKEARKYDSSSRMVGIQREITERAIELLKLPSGRPSFILDVGCGSGLSGQVCSCRLLSLILMLALGCIDVSCLNVSLSSHRTRISSIIPWQHHTTTHHDTTNLIRC